MISKLVPVGLDFLVAKENEMVTMHRYKGNSLLLLFRNNFIPNLSDVEVLYGHYKSFKNDKNHEILRG